MKLKNDNKLTDDELEQVVGGSNLAQDSRFLNVLLEGREGHCGRYGYWTIDDHKNEVIRAWKSVGVDYATKPHMMGTAGGTSEVYTSTHYYINGKEVSQYDAWLHAEQVVGKHLKRSDWDW